METARPIRRNLSRREQRLQDAARQIVTRSSVPLTAEERRAAEQKSAEERERWRGEYAKRSAAARRVVLRAEARAQSGDPWIARARRMLNMGPAPFVRAPQVIQGARTITVSAPVDLDLEDAGRRLADLSVGGSVTMCPQEVYVELPVFFSEASSS
jgi:hypothetical protein